MIKKEIGIKEENLEILRDLFEPDEGSVNMYYGRIGNGKTYAATADILDLLSRGRVVYCNWHIEYDGFDERESFWHIFYKTIFFQKRFYRFPKENLHYFSPDDVSVEFLSSLNDCEIFIDEGQWVFDSYEGLRFGKEKRRLILHTRHLNRSLNIISQRTQAIQVSARGQVNRFFKCEKKMQWPFLIFRRTEFQDMKDNDVDETTPISKKSYFANKKVLNSYDTKYLRAGVKRSQEIYFDAFNLNIFHKTYALLRTVGRKDKGKLEHELPASSQESPPEKLDLKPSIKDIKKEDILSPMQNDVKKYIRKIKVKSEDKEISFIPQ